MFRFNVFSLVLHLVSSSEVSFAESFIEGDPRAKQLLFSFGLCERIIEHELFLSQISLILIPKEPRMRPLLEGEVA